MAKKKLTNDQVREALINARGLTTLAADALGVDWKTIMRYIDASEPLQDVIKVARHKRTQFAKSKLDEAIIRGESWAIMFTLKNKIDPDAEFVGEKHALDVSGNMVTKVIFIDDTGDNQTPETPPSASGGE